MRGTTACQECHEKPAVTVRYGAEVCKACADAMERPTLRYRGAGHWSTDAAHKHDGASR